MQGEATKENNNVQAKKNADEAARLEQERLDKESEAAEMKVARDAIALAMAKDTANDDQSMAQGEAQMVQRIEVP